jgi:hypothetical protein
MKNLNCKPKKFYYLRMCRRGWSPLFALMYAHIEYEAHRYPIKHDVSEDIISFRYKFTLDKEDLKF